MSERDLKVTSGSFSVLSSVSHLLFLLFSLSYIIHLQVLVGRVCYVFFVWEETMVMESWWCWAEELLKCLLASGWDTILQEPNILLVSLILSSPLWALCWWAWGRGQSWDTVSVWQKTHWVEAREKRTSWASSTTTWSLKEKGKDISASSVF